MKQFYELVRVDAESLRFYVLCPICGRKQYGQRIPLLCRSARALARCSAGRAGRFRQSAFNRARAAATQLLALQCNQCRHCHRWVCDDCYDITDPLGACRSCAQNNKPASPIPGQTANQPD